VILPLTLKIKAMWWSVMFKMTVGRQGKPVDTKVDAIDNKLAKKLEKGLRAVANELLKLSQDLVPVDTGELKASGGVRQIDSGLSAAFIVGYGRTDRPAYKGKSPHEGKDVERKASEYAVYVHQDPDRKPIRENIHPVGQALFLYEPLMKEQDQLRWALHVSLMVND
jgi:hypothetical protein